MNQSNLKTELGLKYPIFWNPAAIEPDFAIRLVYKITTTRPQTIVDIGSGLSTVVMLKALKNLGIKHKVYSIDADEWFLNETKNILIAEDLYDPETVELIYAPIETIRIDGKERLWHKIDRKWDFERIDLLVVDGPLGSLSKESRYPALPYFKKYIKPGSSIFLDDFHRDEERSIVEKWLAENKYLEFVYRGPSEKGQAEMVMHDSKRNKIYKDIPPPVVDASALNHQDAEINRLQAELNDLYKSRSWKLSRKLSSTYSKVRGRR